MLIFVSTLVSAQKKGFEIIRNDIEKRVDILIDGKPFTSYIWPVNLKKPVLFPIRTANGTIVTRRFPLEARAGESIDHPHQVGLWFNYGDVNGVDFWNNSIYRTADKAEKMGTIVHRRVVQSVGGKSRGEITVEADWIMPDGKKVLTETTKFVFLRGRGSRSIDRITTLTALNERVIFNDSKEGLFGLRVRRELEQPTKEAIFLTDADGKSGANKVLDNKNVSGEFRSSEGKTGDDVWGTRGKWATLSGTVGRETITLAIFDDPKNPGAPTYWMARGYGLFAANPLGQRAYSTEKKEVELRQLNFTLEPNHSVSFRFRLLIMSNKVTTSQIESKYQNFIGTVK